MNIILRHAAVSREPWMEEANRNLRCERRLMLCLTRCYPITAVLSLNMSAMWSSTGASEMVQQHADWAQGLGGCTLYRLCTTEHSERSSGSYPPTRWCNNQQTKQCLDVQKQPLWCKPGQWPLILSSGSDKPPPGRSATIGCYANIITSKFGNYIQLSIRFHQMHRRSSQ